MKKISCWAKRHQWQARVLIVLGFCLLTIAAIITGTLLDQLLVVIPSLVLTISILFFYTVILLYPAKTARLKINSRSFYKRQKFFDTALAAITFLMIVYISNDRFRSLHYFSSAQAAVVSTSILPKDSTIKTYKSLAAFSASLKSEDGKLLKWKERKKLLKDQIRAIKKSNEPSKGGKVALIVLSVIVAVGLVFGLSVLACSLSCNGSEAAAVLIGIGGTALIIFLLVTAIRAINGKKRKKKAMPEEEPLKT